MNLFDFMDMLFGTQKKFEELTQSDMERNFFMVNRMMAIKYPVQAQAFNNKYVDKQQVLSFWREFIMRVEGKGKPKFLYTSSEGKEKSLYWEPDDKELYKKYLSFYKYTKTDFRDASVLDIKATKKSFSDFKRMLK